MECVPLRYLSVSLRFPSGDAVLSVVCFLWALEAIGKSAAEAAARSAMDSTGWVSNDDVALSNGDGDHDGEDNNEDFMNSTDHVEEGAYNMFSR